MAEETRSIGRRVGRRLLSGVRVDVSTLACRLLTVLLPDKCRSILIVLPARLFDKIVNLSCLVVRRGCSDAALRLI